MWQDSISYHAEEQFSSLRGQAGDIKRHGGLLARVGFDPVIEFAFPA